MARVSLLSSSCLGLVFAVPLSALGAVVLRWRWCRAALRPGAGARGFVGLSPLPLLGDWLGRAVRFGVGLRLVALLPLLLPLGVSTRAARGSGAARLTVGGRRLPLVPRRGLAPAGSVGLSAPRLRRGFRRHDLRGRLSSAAWIHGGRGVPLPLRSSVPMSWARAAGRSFLPRCSGGAFPLSGLPLPPAAIPSGLASALRSEAFGASLGLHRCRRPCGFLRLPAPSPASLGLFLAAGRAVVLYGRGGGGAVLVSLGDWLGV